MNKSISKELIFRQISNLKLMSRPNVVTHTFYTLLRNEVINGNLYLSEDEQLMLQQHYPVMMNHTRYMPESVVNIYVCRRSHAVKAILESENPIVFDAGCGYGSESFLFASLGAKVLSVDHSEKQITIAKKRKRYFEKIFDKNLEIEFVAADLNEYIPELKNLSMTWLASVLAAIKNQQILLKRIIEATRKNGKIMITDMNLLNPLFLWNERHRRRRAFNESSKFAAHANFREMVWRKNRVGARYFPRDNRGVFDDVQFFTPRTLANLLSDTGFKLLPASFYGFVPPLFYHNAVTFVERTISKMPVIQLLGG